MLKQVSAAILCVLVLASCAPTKPEVRIDGTSKEAYEKSLVLMASGLTSSEKDALSLAIEIIQENNNGLSQLSVDANKRMHVTGKTHSELLDSAKAIVLAWFDREEQNEKSYYQLRSELTGKVHLKILSYKEKPSVKVGRIQNTSVFSNESDAVVRISNESKHLISNPLFTDENNLYVFSRPRIGDIKPNGSVVVKITFNRHLSNSSIHFRSVEVEALEVSFDVRNLVGHEVDEESAYVYAPPFGPRKYNEFLRLIGHKRQIPS